MICIPTRKDFEQIFEHLDQKEFVEPFFGPTEPVQTDENIKARQDLKALRKKEKMVDRKKFKVLKRKLLAAKSEKLAEKMNLQKGQDFNEQSFDEKITKLSAELDKLKKERLTKRDEFSDKQAKLWIDDIIDTGNDNKNLIPTIRPSSTREIIGFVTFGGTCFKKSKQIGLGFAPMTAVKQVKTFLLTFSYISLSLA